MTNSDYLDIVSAPSGGKGLGKKKSTQKRHELVEISDESDEEGEKEQPLNSEEQEKGQEEEQSVNRNEQEGQAK